MREYLKVKVLSLIEERRIIKTEEDRVRERYAKRKRWLETGTDDRHKLMEAVSRQNRDGVAASGLWQHEDDLALLCRLTHLAYGFVRGRTYPQMESKVRYHGPKTKVLNKDQLKVIHDMAKKYDEDKEGFGQRWGKFLQDAENVPVVRVEHGSRQARAAAHNARPKQGRRDPTIEYRADD